MEEYYNMSLITEERMIRNQAKLMIRDYEKYGSLSKEERENCIYCQGAISILLHIVDTIHDRTITEEELNHLYNKLQKIIDRKEE